MTTEKRLAGLIKRYRLGWAWGTLALYVVAVPATVMIFPSNSLWLALVVLFSGFTASMTTLADLLTTADASDAAHGHTEDEQPSE
jgi:hypothetical protein